MTNGDEIAEIMRRKNKNKNNNTFSTKVFKKESGKNLFRIWETVNTYEQFFMDILKTRTIKRKNRVNPLSRSTSISGRKIVYIMYYWLDVIALSLFLRIN